MPVKWGASHKDDITGATIVYVKGHELYGDSYITAAVYSERVPEYRGGPKVLRHFAVVEDTKREIRWEDRKAYKSIKDAKAKAETWLQEALKNLASKLSERSPYKRRSPRTAKVQPRTRKGRRSEKTSRSAIERHNEEMSRQRRARHSRAKAKPPRDSKGRFKSK